MATKKPKSFQALRADVTKAKRARAEWIELFGDRPTRGLVILTQVLERAQVRACAAASRDAVRQAFGTNR